MIEILYQVGLWLSLAVGLLSLLLGLIGRPPSGISVGAQALVELYLIVQLVASIAIVASGARAKNDTVEFFAYLITAVIIPIGAVLWALLERSKWSTVVLGVSALAIAVMLVRMHQIWTGSYA
ncbi:MAG: hypothetical protein RIR34_849 [Actinomycetota bacterium]|jgi:uncharacterized membrane protein